MSALNGSISQTTSSYHSRESRRETHRSLMAIIEGLSSVYFKRLFKLFQLKCFPNQQCAFWIYEDWMLLGDSSWGIRSFTYIVLMNSWPTSLGLLMRISPLSFLLEFIFRYLVEALSSWLSKNYESNYDCWGVWLFLNREWWNPLAKD
jgi:hypothetical protein